MEKGHGVKDKTDGGSPAQIHLTQFLAATLKENGHSDKSTTALIILNSPISDFECFERLYNHASYVLCVDGGANRLHDLLVARHHDQPWASALQKALPNAVHGDLDSVRDDVRKKYEQVGVQVSHDPDQYCTDFGKAIKKVMANVPCLENILVLGSIGGRVDQGIGLLHEMYREQKFNHPELRFWLFTESSISILLQKGTTTIHTPINKGLITPNVGILPLYGKACISIKGFEWDVTAWATEMGRQVSTSNHIMADQVFVTTDTEVLFTVERQIER
ncbi:Thiamine pyrophosphokinase 2 [Fulvia fulva]|uniref:Thiamine pyrophosphokinase n=1 Tax=Passalora fulva TaxID=5499 RepID=A0A9Q8LB68_PASFU|nr:Thiamine pyrophosphokinase 2 [Fulvia fulva]KAK4632412.1 Thiamine pyrophosphokinase 2 [Fulvia fulva]KAK4632909.1 Thiamine pyrophosphokinase 2 [Fulvia fulva]UJO14212.1 Thiamine pyrophosphokinase 2 [Fulvia fulva]WPV10883.1 Thiamine pyrophosphokinase 2 [Fulvia fulva]WPV25399.1 Thiamine pyrophosphokinase 2 [Fulvia fulva]